MKRIYEQNENTIKLRSNAKVNFGLSIIGKGTNGKYLIDTIMLPIKNIYDEIIITKTEGPDKVFESYKFKVGYIELSSEHNNVKILKRIKEDLGIKDNFIIKIEKSIPVGSGLGGVSSNIACIAFAINKLYGTIRSNKDLEEIVSEFSWDAPFFIGNKVARVLGDGKDIKEIPFGLFNSVNITLIQLPMFSSTRKVFGNLSLKIIGEQNITRVLKALGKRDFLELKEHLKNDLQESCLELYPNIKNEMSKYENTDNEIIILTGSGSNFLKVTSEVSESKN